MAQAGAAPCGGWEVDPNNSFDGWGETGLASWVCTASVVGSKATLEGVCVCVCIMLCCHHLEALITLEERAPQLVSSCTKSCKLCKKGAEVFYFHVA